MSILSIYKITTAQMRGRCRRRDLCEARQMHWLILSESGSHVTEIAQAYNRDRVTVRMGIKHIKELIEVDKSVRGKYELIKAAQ